MTDKKLPRRLEPHMAHIKARLRVPQDAAMYIRAHLERDEADTQAEHCKALRQAFIDVAHAHGVTLS